MYAVSVQYTQRSCMNTCMVAHTQYRFLVFANKTALVVAGACGHVSVYRLLGGCAPAFLSMWVHAYFCCVICNERWALISFSDICGPASHGICVYTLTIPPPHTLPYYPGTQHPLCSLSQWDPPQWGGIPWDNMGARRRHLRLVGVSADSVCLRAHHYLYHAPPRPQIRPHTHTTPLHASTLHSHLLPAHTAPPHSHLYFGYKLPVRHVPLGLVSVAAKDSVTLHIHSTHSINTHKHPTPTRLGIVYKRALVVPPSSPHQGVFVCGACIGTAQVGVSLVSLFGSTLQTFYVALCRCIIDVIFVTPKIMMTIPTTPVTTPPWYAVMPDLLFIPLCLFALKM